MDATVEMSIISRLGEACPDILSVIVRHLPVPLNYLAGFYISRNNYNEFIVYTEYYYLCITSHACIPDDHLALCLECLSMMYSESGLSRPPRILSIRSVTDARINHIRELFANGPVNITMDLVASERKYYNQVLSQTYDIVDSFRLRGDVRDA